MINNGLFESKSEEWATPQQLFDDLDRDFNFVLDVCATEQNAKCKEYFTKDQDGLSQSWDFGGAVYCNPPYGRHISKWIEKAFNENLNGVTVVLLLPARTDTQWFHRWIYKKHQIEFLKGRLHFNESKNSVPFPSMIVVMRSQEEKKHV